MTEVEMIMDKNVCVKSAYWWPLKVRSSPNLLAWAKKPIWRVRPRKNTPSSWSHRPTCQRNQQRKKWTSARLNRQLSSTFWAKKPIRRARTRVQPSTKTLLTLVGLDGSMRPDAEVSLVSHLDWKLLARTPSDSLAMIRPERREGASNCHTLVPSSVKFSTSKTPAGCHHHSRLALGTP